MFSDLIEQTDRILGGGGGQGLIKWATCSIPLFLMGNEKSRSNDVTFKCLFYVFNSAPVTPSVPLRDSGDVTTSPPNWSSPAIIITPANTTAELGAKVSLTCSAEGNPKLKIRYCLFSGSQPLNT